MLIQIRNQDGFTILQAISTILILSILLAIVAVKYVDLAANAKRAKCLENQGALSSAATISYAESAQTGTPSYPESLASLEEKMARCYTDECANQDGTPLVYDTTSGKVTCPNHP
jgi:type II secretory pathway pseudopilin PulG